jgi:hypothetical protein
MAVLELRHQMRYARDMKSSSKLNAMGINGLFKLIAFVTAVFLGLPVPIFAAGSTSASEIQDALGNKFCPGNLRIIVAGADSEPETEPTVSDAYRHFGDEDILKSLNFLEREKRKILNLCANADTDQNSRVLALYHLGLLCHVAQDFYRKSNYVEIKSEELQRSKKDISSSDLYNLELIDWSELIRLLRDGGHSSIRVKAFDKSNPNSEASSHKVAGVTYFDVARELSVRETERQWHQIESLIRSHFHGNGPSVLAALLNASVPDSLASEIINDKARAIEE